MKREIEDEGYCDDISHDDIDGKKIPAGLWLVGDQGVYLMSNGKTPPLGPDEEATYDPAVDPDGGKSEPPKVLYANEVNPKTLDFDTWYDNKRASFGGDDGVEFLSAEMLQDVLYGIGKDAKLLEIAMSPEQMEILAPETPSEDPSP
jgi:hypothetical protein